MHHPARKRFGQNFLHDPMIIQRIVSKVAPQPGDHIVEIGPGLGALTTTILPLVGELDVIELDRDLIPKLQQQCSGLGELWIHNVDALKYDFTQLATTSRSLRVIGNLPYNISTPLLFHLLTQASAIRDMHFMLQKEVVDRMTAGPGSKTYGRLSIMVQYHCKVEKLFNVGPGAFKPKPKVDSAVVRLLPYVTPPVDTGDKHKFEQIVNAAFSQRRKTLRNSLKNLVPEDVIINTGIDPGLRAEALGIEQFALLSRAMSGAAIN
jgi:16S rRNA (adenine1518-N6/adenine1519-N6)-dimethyltransferase